MRTREEIAAFTWGFVAGYGVGVTITLLVLAIFATAFGIWRQLWIL